jgi:hypothetical protein
MKRKRERVEPELEWRPTGVKRQEALYHHGEPLATLQWESMWNVAATGAAKNGQWQLDRPKMLSSTVEIRTGDTLYGTFSPGWTSEGTLKLSTGSAYCWICEGFWQTRWAFIDTREKPVMRFEDTSGFLVERTAVEIPPSSISEHDRALLAILGRYLMALQARDTAAATAAITAAVC